MTKQAFLEMTRREFETLSSGGQERASRRAFGKDQFFWDHLTTVEIERLWGAIRATALIWEEGP